MWSLLSVFLFLCFPNLKLIEAESLYDGSLGTPYVHEFGTFLLLADAQGDAELTETSRFEES